MSKILLLKKIRENKIIKNIFKFIKIFPPIKLIGNIENIKVMIFCLLFSDMGINKILLYFRYSTIFIIY